MSRDDGDGKPPNPFATPTATGSDNPFDDIMGAAPEAAPNPFAGNPITIQRLSAQQGGPPGAPPAAPPPAAEQSSGLDTGPAYAPPPPPKPVRPELQEWRQEIPRSGATPEEPPNLATASSPRVKALPPPKKSPLATYATIGVVVLLFVVGLGVTQRFLKKDDKGATQPGPQQTNADQLLQLGIRPENAPDCWTRDQGYKFSYLDSAGKNVVVASIDDVPMLYRGGAKCLLQR